MRNKNNERNIELLGGYEIDDSDAPHSKAPFLVGAPQNGSFRGTIGLIGIASGDLEIDDVNDFVKQLIKKKEKGLSLFSRETLSLWLSGDLKDESEFHHEVKPYRVRAG